MYPDKVDTFSGVLDGRRIRTAAAAPTAVISSGVRYAVTNLIVEMGSFWAI